MEEKDEKERNDGSYNRTKMAGRKRQEDEQKESKKKSKRTVEKESYKKKDIRKKQEDLLSTVRILFLSGLTVDCSICIGQINTEWVLIRFYI